MAQYAVLTACCQNIKTYAAMYLLNHKVVKKRTFQMCVTAQQSAIQQAPVDQNNYQSKMVERNHQSCYKEIAYLFDPSLFMSMNESSAAKNTTGIFQ